MSAFIRATFGAIAPFLADYGYTPVPIAPGAKAPLLDDWQAGHPPGHYLPRCATWGTGILTATTPAVDLDVKDRELVRVLLDLAADMLGPSPFRVGAPPKVLLPFSTAAPFDKLSGRWWALPGENWRAPGYSPHRIEILGAGQQFVAFARHPRGSFYRWRRGCPMTVLRIDLPEITEATARTFLEAAEVVIAEVGGVPLRRERRVWFPDLARPEQHRPATGERGTADWQRLEPETLAKRIDAKHARRTRGGWITSCPAHASDGHRSLSITPRDGGGSVVHCFAECSFVEIAREISSILGGAA